jgi:hypothetical protein
MSMLFLAIVLATVCTVSASAQKKEAAKKETPTPQQTQGTMKEVLSQYVGKTTNLGILKKVVGDYFVLEDDGNTVMHPVYTLHTIKLIKDSESGETRIEIRLIGKD